MARFGRTFPKFSSAVDRLEEAIEDYSKDPSDTVRDGVIQRFEFCTELSWKTMREWLIDEGVTDINTPKSVMRAAYAACLIDDDALWTDLINDRNQTSHIYSEDTARNIFARIRSDYYPAFRTLVNKLNG